MKTTIVACCLFCHGLTTVACATTWYVATTGNDSTGTGSIGSPFRTINHALAECASGDVVEVRGGTYHESSEVRFRNPGITLRSFTGEWAVIEAPLNNEDDFSSCIYIDPDAHHTTLSRLEIAGGFYYGVNLQTKWDWGDPSDTAGAGHVIIEDCVIRDTGRDAIKLTPQCDDITIRRCEIFRTGVGPANIEAENAEGIDGVNCDRVLVQDCVLYDIFSTGVYLKGGSTDCLIERTRIDRCGAAGVMLGFDTSPEYFSTNTNPRYYENIRGTVRNCLITRTGWEGIGLYAASNPAVFNNTLENVCTGNVHAALYFGLTFQDWEPHPGRPPSVNPVLLNNLIVQPPDFSDELFEIRYADELGGMSALEGWPVMDHNGYVISGGGTAYFTDNRPGSILNQGSLAQWRTHAGTDAHSRTDNPLFVSVAATNLQLQATSPYIDAGTNAAWMSAATDFNGASRIAGAAVDVGAFELTGTTRTGRIIGHADVASATNQPAHITAKIAQLRWFFTHASVGGNLITGMNVLHTGNPARYPLTIYNYDGQNGDGDYHGGVQTNGWEGGPDYRAAAEPATTANGIIYECQRGNPDWANKLTCFSNSLVQSGWRFPKVNVVMDKFCWIDPYADPEVYLATLGALEEQFPQTLIVYMTIPLTTETAGTENDARNAFNRAVRTHCLAQGKWLLDIADLQAWSPAGIQQTYLADGVTNQLMCSEYAVDAGSGDFHLNILGRRQVALGWYALAGALFTTDRDGDGQSDGDELIAGTSATDSAAAFRATETGFDPSRHLVIQWPFVTGRVYTVQTTPVLHPASWSNLPPPPGGNSTGSYTTDVPSSLGFYRITATQ